MPQGNQGNNPNYKKTGNPSNLNEKDRESETRNTGGKQGFGNAQRPGQQGGPNTRPGQNLGNKPDQARNDIGRKGSQKLNPGQKHHDNVIEEEEE